MLFGALMFMRGKIFQDLGDNFRYELDLHGAKRIYEFNVNSGGGDFATLRLATAIKEIGTRCL